jgi:chromosome segregation ATPase
MCNLSRPQLASKCMYKFLSVVTPAHFVLSFAQVLGRASELNSFVKNNADSGHIEIELKGPKGQPNLVVKRNLLAKSKGSTFTLNGVNCTGREINTRMAALNVQVGNLWCVQILLLRKTLKLST